MTRALIVAIALAALPAAAFDLEKWADKLGDRMMEKWEREAIETLAKGSDPKERAEAAERFGGRKEPHIMEMLGAALSDRDARVREAAASALWKSEKAAEPARAQLVAALNDPDTNVVARVAGALQALGMKEAELAAPRKRVLAAPDSTLDSRFLVARNLVGEEPPAKLVEPMIAYLERSSRPFTGRGIDPNRHNAQLAEQALERIVKRTKDRSLIPPLTDALRDAKHSHVVLVKTLGFYEPKPDGWAETLVGLLDSGDPRLRYAALGEMRSLTTEKDVRVWSPRAAAMLQDADASVRSGSLWALGNAGGLASSEIDKVVAALGDPDKNVRRTAARAIGEIGEHKQAVPAAAKARVANAGRGPLTAAMEKDEDKDVRSEAKDALAKLGGATVVASAAPSTAAAGSGTEAGGMAVLRARKVSFEQSSYMRALYEVDVELVRAFLDAGMSPKDQLGDNGPPMRVVFFHGKACNPGERPTKAATKEMVKMLLERGADINGADKNGNTPLMEAAGKGCDREVMRALIKAGAKVNATNAGGSTPFEMGLWMGHDGLEELIAAGYRLPPDKVKAYTDGYKDRPAALAMIKKAARK